MQKTMLSTIVCGLVLGASTIVVADTNQADQQARLQALEQKLAAQQAEIQQLRAANGESWLNERRTEEVKSLIREVLSDADTRASLAEGGMTAGWRDHFFLASEDGNFLLRLSGQVQTRYTYNQADNAIVGIVFNPSTGDIDSEATSFADENEAGFGVRRAKIRFDGHLFDPKFTYAVQLAAFDFSNSDSNTESVAAVDGGGDVDLTGGFTGIETGPVNSGSAVLVDDAWFAYEFADGWQVKGGQFKVPFLREEAVDSAHQLAMERSYTSDLFTADRSQGVQLSYGGELAGTPIRAMAMLHDGSYQGGTEYNSDVTDLAIAARVEVMLAGDWAQFEDFQAWSTDSTGILIGAAIDYEEGEGGRGTATYDILKWTVDASIELPEVMGLTLYGAVIGQDIDANDDSALTSDADQIAFVLQAGLFVIPDKMDVYARYEYLDLDGMVYFNFPGGFDAYNVGKVLDDEVSILTFGTNYYFHKHAAKATLDVVWVLDNLPASNSGQGLRAAADDDQFTIRAQFQFLF